MITFFIKTWSCSKCGYRQDFEPTQENQNIHFNYDTSFKLNYVRENECPSCALQKVVSLLERETDEKKKMQMNFYEETDSSSIYLELDSESQRQIADGTRFETDEEKTIRIENTMNNYKFLSDEEIQKKRNLFEDK